MNNIAGSYRSNMQSVYHSDLSVEKKQLILERIMEQLKILSHGDVILELTNDDRADLHEVHIDIVAALKQLEELNEKDVNNATQ